MVIKAILIGVLLFCLPGFSQLYVGPNSYLFVKNQYITVNQNVNLSASGAVYLRDEAQLLQRTTANSTNLGLGSLSIFQEGTANNFGYNYWCSPVGSPSATSGNTAFGITQLKRPSGLIDFAGESITNAVNGTTTNSSLTISDRWIYTLTTTNQYANWVSRGSTTSIDAGQGFTMKGVSGTDNTTVLGIQNNSGNRQRYDFRGKPNDGNINISVGNAVDGGTGYAESTLTGNPYPSAINLNLFLLENSGYTVNYTTGAISTTAGTTIINGNACFWEHEKPATSHVLNEYIGGYGVYVPNNTNAFSPGTYTSATWNTYNGDGSINTIGSAAGSTYKRMFSPVGQGFIVKGNVASGTAVMRNRYRVFLREGIANESQFERLAPGATATLENTNWDHIPNLTDTDYTQFSKLPTPQIRIQAILNNQFTREVVLAFNEQSTDGFDLAFDAPTQEITLPTDVYFPITSDNQFVISTVPFNINKRIPFVLKANNASTYRIYVDEIINFTGAENVYLYDAETNIYHDIKNGFVDISLPAGGTSTNRFEVTFLDSTLATSPVKASDLQVIQNNEEEIVIRNPGLLALHSATLFDMVGKLIFTKLNLGTQEEYTIPIAGLAESVYIIKITTSGGQEMGRKLSLQRARE
jgi:hypothetical protein